MIFNKIWEKFKGHVTEQVKQFKYLGINLHYKHYWVYHRNVVASAAQLSAQSKILLVYHKILTEAINMCQLHSNFLGQKLYLKSYMLFG